MAKKTITEIQTIPVSQLEVNRGQIYGLPKNPRFIKDERFNALKKSLAELPEMTNFRPCIVYPSDNGKHVVIAGNMRFRAAVDLGWKQINCVVLPKETPVAKLRAITIKDNAAFEISTLIPESPPAREFSCHIFLVWLRPAGEPPPPREFSFQLYVCFNPRSREGATRESAQ